MAFSHGKAAVFWLDNASASLTNITAYITDISLPEAADTAETTVLGDTSKTYIPGTKGATISIEGKWDPTLDAILASALGNSTTKSFEYGPAGSANGAVKITGECFATAYELSTGIGDAATFNATLQITDDVGRSTWSA